MFKNETLKKYQDNMRKKIAELTAIARKNPDTLKTHFSNGNSKIGKVLNVSTAPVFTCHNCDGCRGFCYDIKACLQYTNTVLPARAENTVLAIHYRDKFFDEIEKKLKRRRAHKFFRWHVGGEIIDFDYFCRMVEVAKKFPDFYFWTYTKMYTIVNMYVEKYGRDAIPKNFTIMFSEWDGMPIYNPYNFPVFSCKLKAGNKNHTPDYFNNLWKCPGNCDICKKAGRGCMAAENTYADEH